MRNKRYKRNNTNNTNKRNKTNKRNNRKYYKVIINHFRGEIKYSINSKEIQAHIN